MTFYGLEQPIDYGRQQVFDPSTAEMVLNAQRLYANAVYNDYKQGLEDMKEFNEKYGDFQSLIAADQDWWNQNVTGKVRDFIDYAYQNGVDLLRSPQGRAELSRLINSMPYGEMALKMTRAKNAEDYYKNMATLKANGLYDRDFSEFLEENPDQWASNSVGVNTPTTYKDLNNWTHHLFDDMELSYDPELSKKYPGYLAYTKSRDTMGKIVDNNIAQLANTDLGRYYLSKYLNELPDNFQGDRNQEALKRLKDEIINSNWEEGQVKLQDDPYALAKYKHNLEMQEINARAAQRDNSNSGDLSYNYLTGVFQRGITTPFGYDKVTGGEQALDNMMKNQYTFGQSLVQNGALSAQQSYKSKGTAYVNKFTIYEAPAMFASSIARQPLDSNGSVLMAPDDVKYLRSTEDIVTNTYGYPNARLTTDYNKIPKPIMSKSGTDESGNPTTEFSQNIIMIPYRDIYTAYRKSGSIESDWRVRLVNADTGENYGDYWYSLPIESERNLDVPRISEWRKDKDGNYYLPKTKDGKRRDRVKGGVRQKTSGYYETSSLTSNKNMGVTKHGFNAENAFGLESIARTPF